MKKILFIMMSFTLVLSGCSDKQSDVVKTDTTGGIGADLTHDQFTISLDDAYYTDFPHDGIETNFDRYLATDLTITNSGDDPTVAKTLTNFTIVDKSDNLSRVMIDENKKKFNSNLMPSESFNITLVFPVDKSDEYTLYYSAGAEAAKENVLSWTFSLDDNKTGEVENTVEHRNVNDVIKTFLYGDGSKEIDFEYKKAKKSSEETSEVSEVTANE